MYFREQFMQMDVLAEPMTAALMHVISKMVQRSGRMVEEAGSESVGVRGQGWGRRRGALISKVRALSREFKRVEQQPQRQRTLLKREEGEKAAE